MRIPYRELFEHTTYKIFDDIFNYTDITLKHNVKLTALNHGKAVRNMINTNVIGATLPDTVHRYYMFICDSININNLLYMARQWMTLEYILNHYKINVDCITSSNKIIPKSLIYVHIDHSGSCIFAINEKAYMRLASSIETYFVINTDSDIVNERYVVSHIPKINENFNNMILLSQTIPDHQKMCVINGYVVRPEQFAVIGNPNTDYYELYVDENIQFVFVVDMTDRYTYRSSEEDLYKDLFFIPQELCGDQVFTYDTISLVVRDYTGKGLYLPYLADKSVSQLTHTCFSVSSFMIDALFDKLNITVGELVVMVSNYSKTNVHHPNGSLTEHMYKLDDTTIRKLILGQDEVDVPYWYADALEKRTYGKYLTDIDELETYSEQKIRRQIECLGYYEFLRLMCQTYGEFSNLGSTVEMLNIELPLFWKNENVYPVLYADGKLIPNTLYNFTKDGDVLVVTFGLPYPLDFEYSIVQYELIRQPKARTYRYDIDSSTGSVEILKEHGDVQIFIQTQTLIRGLSSQMYVGYQQLHRSTGTYFTVHEEDDRWVFVFKQSAYGKTIVFTYKDISMIMHYPNVDISSGENIRYYTYSDLVDSLDNGPDLTGGQYEMYLNNRYLVEGIDFCTSKLIDPTNTSIIGGTDAILQNLKFMNEAYNRVDIIKTGKVVLKSDIGYIVDGIIPKNKQNEGFVRGITRIIVNGKLVPYSAIQEKTTHYEIDSRYCGNGYVYKVITSIPAELYRGYEAYVDDSYLKGREQVFDYFTKDYTYSYPELIVVDYGNKVFSTYLNEVIHRILDGTIIVNYINDDNDIVNQLKGYEYLKQHDVLFRQDGKLDMRFVDCYPGYLATKTTNNLNHYKFIRRLVKIYLGSDNITDYTVVYTGV